MKYDARLGTLDQEPIMIQPLQELLPLPFLSYTSPFPLHFILSSKVFEKLKSTVSMNQ